MSNSKRKSHCGKAKHETLLAAQIALRKTLANHRKGDPIVTYVEPYKCQYCDGWHIGRNRARGINWEAIEQHDKRLRELKSGRGA